MDAHEEALRYLVTRIFGDNWEERIRIADKDSYPDEKPISAGSHLSFGEFRKVTAPLLQR